MSEYRILNLRAENVKRIKAIDITPDPDQNVITITGRNGQGKTSVLDSIFWALTGKDKAQDMPIRKGEETAKIEIDPGEYKIKRTFTAKGVYVTVENADGFKSSSPQAMLDGLMGSIAFDPLEFTRQQPKAQYEALRALVDMDVDIDALDKDNKADFEERTVINRQVKELEAQIADIIVPEDAPAEPVIVAELVNQRDVLTQQVAAAEKLDRDIQAYQVGIDDLKQQIALLQNRIANGEKVMAEAIESRKALKVPTDAEVNALTEQIQDAERLNAGHQKYLNRINKEAERDLKKKESERLTDALDKRNKFKAEALARAKMPIDGLGFVDGTVTYNGVPFEQASNAEQIKVSTAIAMAMNPKLRVIRIKDGSLLDDDSMATLRDMARDNNFQVWIERVSDTDPIAIVIEDGEVVG